MTNILYSLGKKAQISFKNRINTRTKNKVLEKFASLIEREKKLIIRENNKDINFAIKNKVKENLLNRLLLNSIKIKEMQSAIINITKFKDPIGVTINKWKRPNGLIVKKVSIPIGVIGVIYESRPNVTSDVSSLCFKSGNAVILRGGSEAFNTNKILVSLFRRALKKNKVDPNYVQFINKRDRKIVDIMLSKMDKYIDVIIPRGGKTLVKKVQELSSVPIIGHLEGICHTYIDKEANLTMAKKIVHNAKLRNTSICGATETLLMHKKIIKKFSNPILDNLERNNCKIYADRTIRHHYKGKSNLAIEKDWSTEYLSAKISVKSVNNLDEAINHVNKYGTMHTDCIITKNIKTAKIFLNKINSSIAIHNASTQFADGGEFGFGGEVGISTNKLPPRGPVGLNQLISYKYEVLGKGQIRK